MGLGTGLLLTLLCTIVTFIFSQSQSLETDTIILPILNLNISLGSKIYCQPPPNFPRAIPLTQQTFNNWANDLVVQDLWTAVPKSVDDLVRLVNWAANNGYTVRASGYMHNWSPLTVTKTTSCSRTKVILVKTTSWLTGIRMISNNTVKVQTGVSLEALLTFLEKNGAGLSAAPAPGDITIGGIIAIGGHGTGIPASGETLPPGFTYGSLSNLVVALTAIVWDPAKGQYVTREFQRSESDTKAFLVNLGRTFLIDVTFRVGKNVNLRCESRVDIPASELFAAKTADIKIRTFDSFLAKTGRIETIWFPFTSNPWMKVWTVSPNKPIGSRKVSTPYNYPFCDNVPEDVAVLAGLVIEGADFLAPALSLALYTATSAGLIATFSKDIWGPSKNLLLYVRPTTLRYHENGYAVVTARSNVQNVIHSAVNFYETSLKEYRSRGQYPVNGPLEIRVTGLDIAADVGIPQAESPTLSPVKPVQGRPDLNTAVWFDILTFPGTPHANEFLVELESYFLFTLNDGVNAVVRPEWSKGWGYTPHSAYANSTVLHEIIPSAFGRDSFHWTVNKLNEYDPYHVFSNDLLENLLK